MRKFCIFVTASGLWQVFETPAGGWMDRLTGPPLRCPIPALEGLPGRGLSLSGSKAPSCWLARSVASSLVPGTVHRLLESPGWTPTTPPHTHRRLTTLPSTPRFSPRRPSPFQNFIGSASTSSLPLPLPGRGLGWGNPGSKPGWMAHSRTEGFHGGAGRVVLFRYFFPSGLSPKILQLLPLEAQSVLWPSVALMVIPSPRSRTHACTHRGAHTHAHVHTCARTSCQRTGGAVTVRGSQFPV